MIAFDASQFAGRHVFVAGGTTGINFGIATAFAQAGAKVAVMSRSPANVECAVAQLQATQRQTGLPERALGLQADVRQPEAVAAALEEAVRAFGPIDVLVSGAAGNFLAKALDMSPKAFKTVVDIDLLGSFNVARLGYEHLRKPGACVIQISAPQAATPMPFQAHVCAAKAGVDMLTQVLALEWGPSGVRVNSIVPGPIAGTEGIRRLAAGDEGAAAMARRIPLGRMGDLQDIARMALVLASDWGGYITGAVIPVDGGVSIMGPRDFSAAAAATQAARQSA